MAQPATNSKIEELRGRLKADPKNRLFYPLAEELRKVGQVAEAEHVLRTGLAAHPTYLSAWVSLGRVLRDQQKHGDAVDSFTKALQLDPGNVVAARLLGDSYLSLGEKVEAIKKYKLVHALMPGDEDLQATIHRLDLEINRPQVATLSEPEAEPETESAPEAATIEASPSIPEAIAEPSAQPSVTSTFDETFPPFGDSPLTSDSPAAEAIATGDAEPMLSAHDDSPFEALPPAAAASVAAVEIEQPLGMHVETAPLDAEVAAPWEDEPFSTGAEELPPPADEDEEPEPAPAETAPVDGPLTGTLTMADLYARQGLVGEARQIYESILVREPDNSSVRAKLVALGGSVGFAESAPPSVGGSSNQQKIARLQQWLGQIKREEAGRV